MPRWVQSRRREFVELWRDLLQWGERHLLDGVPLRRALGKLVYE